MMHCFRYRSAVLQHKVDNESFIYAVPHDDKDDVKEEGDVKVMASHAIFRMDAGREAPGCVVGFQFEQQAMYRQFKEITSQPYVTGFYFAIAFSLCSLYSLRCMCDSFSFRSFHFIAVQRLLALQ